jgi:hypothetical protein
MRVMQFTRAKAALSSVFDQVERSGPVVVKRAKSAPVALVREDQLRELLAREFAFSTSTSRAEDGTVSIWLEQFGIYGRGSSIAEAAEDLLDEVEEYVEEWEEGLGAAPNHRQRAWWVARVQMAEDRDQLRDVIFATPSAPTPA